MDLISLKAARVNAGLKAREVAERLNVSMNTFSAWENNKRYPNAIQFREMCMMYGVDMHDIFFAKRNN